MKLIIDIPEETQVACLQWDDMEFSYKSLCTAIMVTAIRHGTPIPDNATNGDVIKAMFPNFRQTDHFELTETCEIDYFRNGNEICEIRCSNEWWNAPYQKGGKE